MDNPEIENAVKRTIERWQFNQIAVTKSPFMVSYRSIEFIVELIKNIELDPSETWATANLRLDYLQDQAINYIPTALNNIINNNREVKFKLRHTTITTWEILHSISYFLDSWCFIPKKNKNERS